MESTSFSGGRPRRVDELGLGRLPYKRIDVHESSRYVDVEIAGETVAESRRPQILFETGLPPRYYLPRVDVRTDLLEPSGTVTRCAYKGEAEHFHVGLGDDLHEDVAWRYPFPNPGFGKIQDRICFYDERVDRVVVDGDPRAVPETPWSR